MSDYPHSNIYGSEEQSFLSKYKMHLIIGAVVAVVVIIILIVLFSGMGGGDGFGTMPTRLGEIGQENYRLRPNPISGGVGRV